MKNLPSVWSALAILIAATACTKSSPTRPSDVETAAPAAAVTDAKTGITLTTPQLLAPAEGEKVQFAAQPISLRIRNAIGTGSTQLTYTFQVASDAGFANIAYSKDGVAEGSGDQTSLTIAKLAGARDYFWRARAVSGDLPGLFTSGRSFNVGPEVVLQAPVLATPAQNGTAFGTATLTVNNAARSGPAGQLVYRFEVSDSASFGNLIFETSVAEQPGNQTSTQVTVRLTNNSTYFWRVQATDPSNSVVGPYSDVFSFRYVAFDMSQAVILNSPADLGSWPETAKITSVQFTGNAMLVDFDKRTGPGRWPDEPFGTGSIQYTLGMCLNINSRWYCSAVVQFWFGRELEASGIPSHFWFEWWYDRARWGPMVGYGIAEGEIVGVFVGAGNLRGRTDPGYVTCPRVCERSNVAMVPYTAGSANYRFSGGGQVVATRR